MSPFARFFRISFILSLPAIGACQLAGLAGLPSAQDGTWFSTPAAGALGSATWIVQISQDRMVRVNVSGVDWVVQQSFPANRINPNIVWKTIAQPPAAIVGPLLPATNIEYTLDVTPQADGTMTGTAATGISTIPGISSIPTTSFGVTLRKA